MKIEERLIEELGLAPYQVKNTIELIEEGNTIPFIARYRKEKTGSLTDEVLRAFDERYRALKALEEKREFVIGKILEEDALTDELRTKIEAAMTPTELDDLYAPFRPKRRTRATMAIERGLEPVANAILEKNFSEAELDAFLEAFVTEEINADAALQGAQDILAERIADTSDYRAIVRTDGQKNGRVETAGVEEDLGVYEMYRSFSDTVKDIPNHRILAINRGEREKMLRVKILFREEECTFRIARRLERAYPNGTARLYRVIVEDALKRLLFPRMETELRDEMTVRAEDDAIGVFGMNLRAVLMQSPIPGHVILGIDPGYRTGCKVAVIGTDGDFLESATIYPTKPREDIAGARKVVQNLIEKYGVTLIAIGNGTASRETEAFVAELMKPYEKLRYAIVSEAGASVYSASELGTEEFPNLDVSIRGAISIARRLQDPMAELVKIPPESIGVGQYQHDLAPKKLEERLGNVVEDCVNAVGVDLETASAALLSHIAGLNARLANAIVERRSESPIKSRKEFAKVKGIGPKTFKQCAGFLRIHGDEPLDATAVHPESYDIARMLIAEESYETIEAKTGAGKVTIDAVADELAKKGRDIRMDVGESILRTDVVALEDLKKGMVLKGTVRNVVDFGAFVDIGVHEDGLVHISRLSDRFVKHPKEVVHVGDIVEVTVIDVDLARKRISLSMVGDE